MAAGDIISCTVRADGWSVDLKIEGLATGGTYLLGAAAETVWADLAAGTAKLKLTVQSVGYENGVQNESTTRYVYGTRVVQKPYNLNAQADETVSGSDIICRIAMDDYITDSDTILGCSIQAGLYTKTGVPSAATAELFLCTNSSALTESAGANETNVVCRWLTVPHQRYTGAFTLRAIAFHRTGGNRQPVGFVRFSVYDGTTTVTVDALAPTKYLEPISGLWVTCYEAAFNASSFAQCAATALTGNLTMNVTAYAKRGPEFLTTSGGSASPNMNHGPLTAVDDKNSTYGVTIAYVDMTSKIAGSLISGTFATGELITQAVTGSTQRVSSQSGGFLYVSTADTTGVPTGTGAGADDWTGGTSGAVWRPTATLVAVGNDTTCVAVDTAASHATAIAAPAATINGAADKIRAYNNTNRSRNSADAGVVYLLAKGRYRWGGTHTPIAAATWLTVTRASTLAVGDAWLYTFASGGNLNCVLQRAYDLDIIPNTTTGSFRIFFGTNAQALWMDTCRITGATANAFNITNSFGHATTGVGGVWYTGNTATNTSYPFNGMAALHLGNLTDNGCSLGSAHCVVGNRLEQHSGQTGDPLITIAKGTTLSQDNIVVAYNFSSQHGTVFNVSATCQCLIGFAQVGNIFEAMNNTVTNVALWADSNTGISRHVIKWFNTEIGQRSNYGYNDIAGTSTERTRWSIIGNACQWLPLKGDSSNPPLSGACIGNYPLQYNVATRFNSSEHTASYHPIGNGYDNQYVTVANGYTLNAACTNADNGGGTAAGNGDYTPTISSILRRRIPSGQMPIPWDLFGTPMGTSAGAVQVIEATNDYRKRQFEWLE